MCQRCSVRCLFCVVIENSECRRFVCQTWIALQGNTNVCREISLLIQELVEWNFLYKYIYEHNLEEEIHNWMVKKQQLVGLMKAWKWELAHKQKFGRSISVDSFLNILLTTLNIHVTRNAGWLVVATGTRRRASYVSGLQHLFAGPVCSPVIHSSWWCRTLQSGQ